MSAYSQWPFYGFRQQSILLRGRGIYVVTRRNDRRRHASSQMNSHPPEPAPPFNTSSSFLAGPTFARRHKIAQEAASASSRAKMRRTQHNEIMINYARIKSVLKHTRPMFDDAHKYVHA